MAIIRKVRKDEFAKVALMHNCILGLHAELLPKLFKQANLITIEDVISELEYYVQDGGIVYVAELDGEVVGYIAARKTKFGGDLRRRRIEILYLDAIYVTPFARNHPKKISTQLYKRAMSYAKEEGLNAISYDFWVANEVSAAFCQEHTECSEAHDQIRRIIFI